jgi:flagellum-specific peptidoglycan hydrolase FlgJ
VQSAKKARWQQATALVSLSACGAMTGLAFAHGSADDLTSPTRMPVKLLALNKPAKSAAASDSALRAAIVKSARYYLSLAQSRSPADMEALIWQNDSVDGVDHGESCAAFASLTLESGAQATGQQSWVSGGTTYPWPVHAWVDSRVDPNPDSLNIVSILQDAQAHQRWHPLGDGYTPQPGDWVLFDGHVEVVTKYADGVLYTIGGDSLPNLSVNAHQYDAPLAAQGVAGFVNNGNLLSTVSQSASGTGTAAPAHGQATQGQASPAHQQSTSGQADIPGTAMSALSTDGTAQANGQAQQPEAARTTAAGTALTATATIPGALPITGSITSYSSAGSRPASSSPGSSSPRYGRSQAAPTTASAPDTAAQQAFINQIAPGALAAERQYGIPAAVTIAQAIEESGWGQSQLAAQNHNLFGIKGTGPAGSVLLPTQEYENGQWVTINAPFRAYSNVAQSINDHTLLLATGSYYKQAMADRRSPDAFANDLTGVYATDPNYGASLISIMRQYNLYRYDAGTSAAHGPSATSGSGHSGSTQSGSAPSGAVPSGAAPSGAAPSGAGPSGVGPGGAGPGSSGLGGSGLSGSLASGTQAGAQPGAAGQGALIPGAVQVNATALGLAAPQGSGQSASAHGASGNGGTARGRVADSTGVRRGAALNGAGRGAGHGTGRGAGHGTGHGSAAPSGASGGKPTRGALSASAGAGGTARQPGGGSSGPDAEGSGGAVIPGLDAYAGATASSSAVQGVTSAHLQPADGQALRAGPRNLRVSTRRYVPQMPRVVLTDFVTTAKIPLLRAKPVYQDVAATTGVRWELLAACDWMQCQAQPTVSPVYGENLGTKNPDGTIYRTKTQALEQCAADLIGLAAAVYGIDLTQGLRLSVRDLANVFAAFRWGGLLKAHRISAMAFPYSVEGLTAQHTKMRWPAIADEAPDKPGTRFRSSFGAVPVVLRLNYPAVA